MSKDLSTKQEKVVECPEKGSGDACEPSYDWLCGVQDGLELLKHELARALVKVKNPKTLTASDLIHLEHMIVQDIESSVAEVIAECFSRVRLLLTGHPSDNPVQIFNMDR
jgi:hypothetical protein